MASKIKKSNKMFGFNSKSKPSSKSGSAPSSTPTTHALNSLVAGTVVEGNIHSDNDIRIDGMIKGKLNCKAKVIIGPKGQIDGEIVCQNAVIEGRFEGKLKVADLLNIREAANVKGEIRYSTLIVQPGAVLVGDVQLNSGPVSNGKPRSSNATKTAKTANGQSTKATAGSYQKERAN